MSHVDSTAHLPLINFYYMKVFDILVSYYIDKAQSINGIPIRSYLANLLARVDIQGVSFILSYLKWLKCALKNDN